MDLTADVVLNEMSFYPITFEQEVIWKIDKIRDGFSSEYNISHSVQVSFSVDPIRLAQSVKRLFNTYPILRSGFDNYKGNIVGVLREESEEPLQVLSSHLERENQLKELACRPFDLKQGPMIRFYLIPGFQLDDSASGKESKSVSDTSDLIFIVHHQIIADGLSIDGIINELMRYYHDPDLSILTPEEEYSFADCINIPKKREYSNHFLDYWSKKLKGYQATKLELGKSWHPRKTNHGRRFCLFYEKASTEAIKKLSQDFKTDCFTVLLGVFYVFLERYTLQNDLTIATTFEKNKPSIMNEFLASQLGIILLRTRLNTNQSFRDFIFEEVKPTVLEAFTHFVPLQIAVERHSGSMFHVMFAYDESECLRDGSGQKNEMNYLCKKFYNGTTQQDLFVKASPKESGLEFVFEYSTELYSEDLIEDFASSFLKMIRYIVDNSSLAIKDYNFRFTSDGPLNPLEDNREESNSLKTIFDHFKKISDQQLPCFHIEYGDESLSSQEFWRTSKAKAFHIQALYYDRFKRHLQPGDCIGISNERSIHTLSDLIAIVFAGGAFVPFDPQDPKDRIDYILNDAGVELSVHSGIASFRNDARKVHLKGDLDNASCSLKATSVKPEQLAYIIYTSGSTGRPKGVRISHQALWAYTRWFGSLGENKKTKRVDFSSSLTFDASITTTLVALAYHHTIVICPESIKKSPNSFLKYLIEKEIELCKSTPSYFKLLVNESLSSNIRISQKMNWLLTGEEMNQKDCAKWLELHPNHTFYNSYGPTEATVTCSKFKVDISNIHSFKENIPIEKDSRFANFHIVDSKMREVPHGVKGELCIEGSILADGYQNKTEETSAAFVTGINGNLWYRTGDTVMSCPDGTIVYFGRRDNQVKIRGIRIELDEVRHCICSLKYVADAMVIVSQSQVHPQLIAFVVPLDAELNPSVFCDQVQKDLLQKLPAAMTPQTFIALEGLPINKSGKIDMQALHSIAKTYSIGSGKMLVSNPLEMTLLRIWRDSFPNSKIGTDSNFFDLGGSSLMVMEVMDKINYSLNTSLPPDLIFQQPTLRELSQAISSQNTDTSIHHFNHCKDGPALVLIHPDSGMAHLYQCLREYLKSADFYGFSNDRFGELKESYKRIEEMADSYLMLLKKHRPKGPYILGGFCTGGVVAFEMARKLKTQPHENCGLVLIDSFKLEDIGSKDEREIYYRNHLKMMGVAENSYFGKKLVRDLEQNRRLVAEYQPSPFEGKCLFLQCKDFDFEDVNVSQIKKLKDRFNGWASFINLTHTHRVEINSTHKSLFQDDKAIGLLGEEINQFIRSFSNEI